MPNDSAPNNGFAEFIEQIKRWCGPIIGVALFVFGLRKGVKEAQESLVWMALAAVSAGWLFLFWVYTSKTTREVWEGIDQQPKIEKAPQFPRWRNWALVGLILIPIFTASGFAIFEHINRPNPNTVIVLIADLKGPEEKHALTSIVINRLRSAINKFPEVKLKFLGTPITEKGGSEEARKKGKENNASIVLWGFFDETPRITVHIELLGQQQRFTRLDKNSKSEGQVEYDASTADKPSISIGNVASDVSLMTLLLVGLARYEKHDYDSAVLRFSAALNQMASPQVGDYQSNLLYFRGTSFLLKGEIDSAINDYNLAIKSKQDDAEVYHNRGIAFYLKSAFDQSIKDCSRAIELKPNLSLTYVNRAFAYVAKGENDKAISDCNLAIELKTNVASVYAIRGDAYAAKGESDRAVNDFSEAIKLDSSSAMAYFNRGIIYSEKGENDKAIADFCRVIELKPDYALGYVYRGNIYVAKGDNKKAITDYNQAIKLKPDLPEAYIGRAYIYGFVYSAEGDKDRAIVDYSHAINIKPDAEAYNNRGFLYSVKGDNDKAMVDYTEAIELKPDYALAYKNRGDCYIRRGNRKEAISDFRKVLEIPTSSELPETRNSALAELKRLGASVK